jgi:hypothetical protein
MKTKQNHTSDRSTVKSCCKDKSEKGRCKESRAMYGKKKK